MERAHQQSLMKQQRARSRRWETQQNINMLQRSVRNERTHFVDVVARRFGY